MLVQKRDGQWRFCVDNHQLNKLIINNKHPLLVIDKLLDKLAGSNVFSKLDLCLVIIESDLLKVMHQK
jgi:hypothetical protein